MGGYMVGVDGGGEIDIGLIPSTAFRMCIQCTVSVCLFFYAANINNNTVSQTKTFNTLDNRGRSLSQTQTQTQTQIQTQTQTRHRYRYRHRHSYRHRQRYRYRHRHRHRHRNRKRLSKTLRDSQEQLVRNNQINP